MLLLRGHRIDPVLLPFLVVVVAAVLSGGIVAASCRIYDVEPRAFLTTKWARPKLPADSAND